ncbi:hypothetical protein PUNSTDRAFT_131294 [Punctularia strigosozonata HHB-11173 SS5]|uniref:uncharacterized protein n=1 Tax=Punctularia strigosozonata (strain HHB-11173) TaxID=741275 RepID=UPI0004416C6C|nr:uncharacterized protein PUNSTDRAFT_131294 [Punctularia strigosozonata HHB-11173 SS5]EIN13070.1 hypothetical protein PUNSTDRAFT_131294 [Punctularia strigosozonata HHB-11173 SS5]
MPLTFPASFYSKKSDIQEHDIVRGDIWFEDGNIFVRAEDHVYKLYSGLLCSQSALFNDLLCPAGPATSVPLPTYLSYSTPSHGQHEDNGRQEEHPLKVPHTAEAFGVFLRFITGQESSDESFASLIMLLDLAGYYQSPRARQRAIKVLDTHPDLTPTIRMHLARAHKIDGWVEPAFRSILRGPYLELTPSDFVYMGHNASMAVSTTQYGIALHRIQCALFPPEVHHVFRCHDERKCSSSWTKAWWGELEEGMQGIAFLLLHDDMRMPGRSILQHIESLHVPGMHEGCKSLTIGSLKCLSDEEGLLYEEGLVNKAVTQLEEFQRQLI